MSTTPLVAVAAVEAAEAQAEVAVVVMAVDAAMEAHPEADEDRAGTLDLEAMFSRILEKSQAAHGTTGAMRLAVEVVRNLWGLTGRRSRLYQDRVDARQCCPQDQRGTLNFACANPDGTPNASNSPSSGPKTVLQQAVRRFEATARLTWVDYTHLDLTRVFAAAVQSVYATSSELQQLREVQRSAYPDYPEYDRHSALYVDCNLTVIVIGGVRILMALLDTGCDYNGVHRRVVDRMKPGEADATLQSMSMQGIGGKMEMQRLVGRISYVINPDIDWERKFEWPSFAILEGDHLPDVIFRIEPQPDNVGADAAVQPEQQDDDAELLELVADSDDEEDFVPCWVEEVPDHVANVIASCFTLRASPMDADSDSDEELPDMMEDSSDDDDVYVELTIMTHTGPEEPDCPADDEELEDSTAMPLREHEDEIPDWRELRRQRQAAGRLRLSGHTLERLALVRAVPHSTPEVTYIIDLDRTGGKEGRAKQGLFLFAGMLSALFTNLVDGDYAGFYTRQELGFTEEEMVIAIGNVSEGHSVNTQELRAAQHELRRSTAAAMEAEMEHAMNMATLKQGTS
eukprot:jgi/Tetstr1/421906/TSEL_012806.t1